MFLRIFALCLLLTATLQSQARFLGEDPAVGDVQNPPSLHKYLYAYQNPTVYVDFDGRTAEQYQAAMTAAIENFRLAGNNYNLGQVGEIHLERLLSANGEVIIKGPVTNKGQHNADLITYNPESDKISFFDNKIDRTNPNVSRVDNLSTDSGKQKSIREALDKLENMDVNPHSMAESFAEFARSRWLLSFHMTATRLGQLCAVGLVRNGNEFLLLSDLNDLGQNLPWIDDEVVERSFNAYNIHVLLLGEFADVAGRPEEGA